MVLFPMVSLHDARWKEKPTIMSENNIIFKLNFLDALASGTHILTEFTIKSYKTKLLESINFQWNYWINKSSLPLVDSVLRGESVGLINYLQSTEIASIMLHMSKYCQVAPLGWAQTTGSWGTLAPRGDRHEEGSL